MLTWIAGNDLLSTEDNLVSFELSLITRDQRDVCISSLLVEIFELLSSPGRQLTDAARQKVQGRGLTLTSLVM